MIDQLLFELPVDGLRHYLEQLLQEAKTIQRKDPAFAILTLKPRMEMIRVLIDFFSRIRPDLQMQLEIRRAMGEWFRERPALEVNQQTLEVSVSQVMAREEFKEKQRVADQCVGADWN
jgi:hypothetical protein